MKLSLATISAFLLLLPFVSAAQEYEVPTSLPTTKEEFIKSENDFIATAKWLESTPIGTDMEKRRKANAWVAMWITNSPTVTIGLRPSIIYLFENNRELLSMYVAGYTRYCLENNYSTDTLKCNVAGIRAAINCYKLGGDVKEDEALSKVIDADKEGKLEDWVKEALKGL